MASTNEQNLVEQNAKYASGFRHGDLALPPSGKLAQEVQVFLLTHELYQGIPLGAAHVIRNAGGSAKEALRSLIISEQLLGTNEIHVIKHTGCGMLTFQNQDARLVIQNNLGVQAAAEVSDLDFLPFPELSEAVKDDIAYLRSQKTIPNTVTISGWVYEVETGKVVKIA
ncbi:MAG: hypothetical protein Q9162_004908 [Coniocarpon cinnabarinum]